MWIFRVPLTPDRQTDTGITLLVRQQSCASQDVNLAWVVHHKINMLDPKGKFQCGEDSLLR